MRNQTQHTYKRSAIVRIRRESRTLGGLRYLRMRALYGGYASEKLSATATGRRLSTIHAPIARDEGVLLDQRRKLERKHEHTITT